MIHPLPGEYGFKFQVPPCVLVTSVKALFLLTPRRQDATNPNEPRAAKFVAGVAAWREIRKNPCTGHQYENAEESKEAGLARNPSQPDLRPRERQFRMRGSFHLAASTRKLMDSAA